MESYTVCIYLNIKFPYSCLIRAVAGTLPLIVIFISYGTILFLLNNCNVQIIVDIYIPDIIDILGLVMLFIYYVVIYIESLLFTY